jgi:cytochrome c oxidase cbb3-type subunit I/II
MTFWAFVAVAIGGIAQIVPLLHQTPKSIVIAGVSPYSPLELAGRDIYISEGCNNCHTQQVRPILGETKRYGTYSRAGEFVYDTPHLWGSKRTGSREDRLEVRTSVALASPD